MVGGLGVMVLKLRHITRPLVPKPLTSCSLIFCHGVKTLRKALLGPHAAAVVAHKSTSMQARCTGIRSTEIAPEVGVVLVGMRVVAMRVPVMRLLVVKKAVHGLLLQPSCVYFRMSPGVKTVLLPV